MARGLRRVLIMRRRLWRGVLRAGRRLRRGRPSGSGLPLGLRRTVRWLGSFRPRTFTGRVFALAESVHQELERAALHCKKIARGQLVLQ